MISARNSKGEHYDASLRRFRHNFLRILPRTIPINQVEPMSLTDVPYIKDFEHDVMRSNSRFIEPNFPELVKGHGKNVCKPMHYWQSKSFPNCNIFHETSLLLLDHRCLSLPAERCAPFLSRVRKTMLAMSTNSCTRISIIMARIT